MRGNDTLLDEALERPFRSALILVGLIALFGALGQSFNSIAEPESVTLKVTRIDAPRTCRGEALILGVLGERHRTQTPQDPDAPFCGLIHTERGPLVLPESASTLWRSRPPYREDLLDRLVPGCRYQFSLAGRVSDADAQEKRYKIIRNLHPTPCAIGP